MRLEARRYHLEVLTLHNQQLFNMLLYESNITSDSLKEIEFEGYDTVRGYFAVKDKQAYFISEDVFRKLPIRLGDEFEEVTHKETVIKIPKRPQPFKIVPEHKIHVRELVDGLAPFQHTNPVHWTLAKMMAIMGYVGRTYVCISSESEFGKSSIFDSTHLLTDKSPVFKPRSIPGILRHLSGNGNIVFDEIHECRKDVKEIIEEVALQIGGMKSVYINGALKAANTKTQYDCGLQSITFLYNNANYYSEPRKEYFDFIFSNNKAIDTRFLKLKLDGKLSEKFDRDFDILAEAETNRMYYISVAKELMYLQQLKLNNRHARRYIPTTQLLNLRGRRKCVFDEITWLIDMYAESQAEYDRYYNNLEQCIIEYKEMINLLMEQQELVEEVYIK